MGTRKWSGKGTNIHYPWNATWHTISSSKFTSGWLGRWQNSWASYPQRNETHCQLSNGRGMNLHDQLQGCNHIGGWNRVLVPGGTAYHSQLPGGNCCCCCCCCCSSSSSSSSSSCCCCSCSCSCSCSSSSCCCCRCTSSSSSSNLVALVQYYSVQIGVWK